MKIAEQVYYNILDAVELGPRFPLRHVSALLGRDTFRAQIPGYGDVYLRSRHSDGQTFRQIFTRKEYGIRSGQAARVQAAYERTLAAGRIPLIVDAGANVGAASIWFAMQFPAARVIAIEPEPGNAEMCRRNVAAAGNVKVIEGAIGATPGYVTLSDPDTESWAFRTTRGAGQRPPQAVPVITFGELLAADSNYDLLIAKIDIEGFEADLFATNTQWLDSLSVLMVELHDWMLPGEHSSRSLQRAVLDRGFELTLSGENLIFVR